MPNPLAAGISWKDLALGSFFRGKAAEFSCSSIIRSTGSVVPSRDGERQQEWTIAFKQGK